MKKDYMWFMIIVLALILSLPIRGIAQIKTMYVTDMLHASIRTGPTTENKIIAFVKSNRSVEVMEESEDWSYVRLSNGKEGWILSRLLIEGPTKTKIIESLTTENDKLKKECSFLRDENTRLKAKSNAQQSKINEQDETLGTLKQKTDDLGHNRPIRWLLSGAFILLTGIFIGYSSRKKKRGMFAE
jgi:SH3 domain protein